jgi:hypothetical protein
MDKHMKVAVAVVDMVRKELDHLNSRIYHQRRSLEVIDDGGPGKIRKMRGCMSSGIAEIEDSLEEIINQMERFIQTGDIDEE